MSKILYPSLASGYILAPEQLVEPMTRFALIQHSPAIDQATLAISDRGVFPEPHQTDAETLF